MSIKAEEIASILEKELGSLNWSADLKEIGYILQVGDGIARVYGLENVQAGEMVKFPNEIYGLVFNLEESNVGCVILGQGSKLKEGDVVGAAKEVVEGVAETFKGLKLKLVILD